MLPSTAVTVRILIKDDLGLLAEPTDDPTALLLRNGSDSGVSVDLDEVSAGVYTASWTNGAWSHGDELQLQVTSEFGANTFVEMKWEGSINVASSGGLDASGIRSAIGLGSANLDTQLGGIHSKTTNLPSSPAAAGDAMTLTSGERSTLAAAIETAMINEGDATALLQAIADRIAVENPSLGDLTLGAIASAVWSNATRTLTANPGLDAAAVRSALGMTAANLDTKIAEILAAFGDIEGGGSIDIDASELADAILPLLITALRPWVIDANLPQVTDAGTFTLTALDDYADNDDINPIGPIRIQTPLDLLRESNPPRLRFGATQRLGSRLGTVKFIGSAYAIAVEGEDDLYDVFIEIPKSELNRAPGAYSWDVEAVFPAGFVSTLFGGMLNLVASMGDNEERDPLNPE